MEKSASECRNYIKKKKNERRRKALPWEVGGEAECGGGEWKKNESPVFFFFFTFSFFETSPRARPVMETAAEEHKQLPIT